eukprot:COSAG01_NODE_249_length_20357_cov_3.458171_18_plen_89_part_00
MSISSRSHRWLGGSYVQSYTQVSHPRGTVLENSTYLLILPLAIHTPSSQFESIGGQGMGDGGRVDQSNPCNLSIVSQICLQEFSYCGF